jgi:tRNA pseudouridine32 synthase/23S rRNA pseudouridine746 synthase
LQRLIPARPLPKLSILFRDQRFVVLDKPAGLPVHSGPRGGPSVEDWFPALSRRKDGPWLAHRLDADTAGCLVIALRRAALLAAQAEFAAGRACKIYWAVVRGAPAGNSGVIEAPLRRDSTKAGWRMRIDPKGQAAITEWRILGRADDIAWLELSPHTGRTHQIRVHCAHLGCPIIGDPVYGDGNGRLHLLARSISLALQPPIAAIAPPPGFMIKALTRCGWSAVSAKATTQATLNKERPA